MNRKIYAALLNLAVWLLLAVPAGAQGKLTYEEYSLTLPDSWEGNVLAEMDDSGLTFYQKESYRLLGGGGRLFSIVKYSDASYINMPSYRLLARDGSFVYTAEFPTDLQCAVEDESVRNEYFQFSEDTDAVLQSLRILSDTVKYDAGEFIFPNSDTVYLQEQDLYNLTADQLAAARNEIYARHGRIFAAQEWADYFAGCSWYQGTVSADDFSESMLSDCERANVALIVAREANGF